MDNSFDKLNSEFADKSRSGAKYWIGLVISFIFEIAGLAVGIYSLTHLNVGVGGYLSLLTLLGGLFGVQTASWAKSGQPFNTPLKVSYGFGIAVAVFACIILYIVMPAIKG